MNSEREDDVDEIILPSRGQKHIHDLNSFITSSWCILYKDDDALVVDVLVSNHGLIGTIISIIVSIISTYIHHYNILLTSTFLYSFHNFMI